MIAEDYSHSSLPISSIPKGTTISCLIDCFKIATPFFKQALLQPDILKPLNENKLTQIFVEQLKIQLRKKELTVDVGSQYSDIFFGTKGVPDFYLYSPEEGVTSIPIFIVEAKRLPAPAKENETEYVKGLKLNGGIERFKIEKHGQGLLECGMLGFIEKEDFSHWFNKINNWITNLSSVDANWSSDEQLSKLEASSIYASTMSKVHINKKRDLTLYHFWALIN